MEQQHAKENGESKPSRWLCLLPLLLLAMVPLYLYAARAHTAKFNHDHFQNDQKVYLRVAQKLKVTDYKHFTSRQRTPGYPYLLSTAWNESYRPDKMSKVNPEWFERAKQFNINLSVYLLIALAVFFYFTIGGAIPSMLATSASGFLLYIFRAGYTQPELLYWTFNVIAYYLLMRMLWSPTWGLAIVSGAITAAAFFIKAGTQPLMILFVVSYAVKLLWDWIYNKRKPTVTLILKGALVPVVFIAVMAPYLYGTYKVFGNPFYSTYSKYIMWVRYGENEYKTEMYAVMNAGAADRPLTKEAFNDAWGKLSKDPPPEIPTFSRYAKEYSLRDFIKRPIDGIVTNQKRIQKYYSGAYSFLYWLILAAIAVGLLNFRRLWALTLEHLPVLFYITGFFLGYLALYGWYDGLRIGARLMLSLYVPALFTVIWFISKYSQGLNINIKSYSINVRNCLLAVFSIFLIIRVIAVFTGELYLNYTGA
jgi:hypothetical protein